MFTLYTLFDAVGRQYLLDRLTNSLTIYFCSPHCAAATRPACSVDNFLGSCVFSVSPPLLGSYSIYVRTHTYTAAPSFVVLASCRSGWVAWDVRFFRCCCFPRLVSPTTQPPGSAGTHSTPTEAVSFLNSYDTPCLQAAGTITFDTVADVSGPLTAAGRGGARPLRLAVGSLSFFPDSRNPLLPILSGLKGMPADAGHAVAWHCTSRLLVGHLLWSSTRVRS